MSNTAPKKLYIKTWGCQMNVYDSRRMADILRPLGYAETDTPEGADMVILNTCHIREKATDKVFSEIGRLEKHKRAKEKSGGKMVMAVAGCVAQAEGDVILNRAKSVDMVFGPQTYHQLPEMMIRATGERVVNTDFPAENKFDSLPTEQNQGSAAFLSIQEGCDKFCTFCVVPYTRGAEYSRDVIAILDEARRLVDQGAKEITLLGQNVNAFHGNAPDGSIWRLGRLMSEMAGIHGLSRLRYMTSHPLDMDEELMAAHRDVPEIMPYLHLPLQAGSDKILKAMNRKHTADDYRRIIDRVRFYRPDISLSSDFIVGFPGETDSDFDDTMNMVAEIGYGSAYSFKYSARPGTPAANMQGLVPEKIKDERLARLQDLIGTKQLEINRRTVGLTLPVLFERPGLRPGQIQGKTPYNQTINVPAPARLIGQIEAVHITEAFTNSVAGDIQVSEFMTKSA
ncbi:MAG: tRNA (N6-isopentenyl adenosine(37)-C2)-methylthiotransferase MiaB [Alphaproteobacteria bacterium]|nr:tRNA (N6-isopentenyl adenosine(37)-C2)-methylthiotransferase MiaB [Alphaproteobacteria bacterium]